MPKVDVSQHLERTRPPARTISGDDFISAVDGVEYHPHVGDWVKMVGSPSETYLHDFIDLRVNLALVLKDGGGMLSTDEGKRAVELLDRVAAELHSRITEWSWMSPLGEMYPAHPSLEDVSSIPFEEFMVLALAYCGPLPANLL